jgi:hypothetical protein
MPSSGETAGTVKEFSEGVLTILLADGKTLVSGKVTEETELRCESASSTSSGDGGEGGASGSDQGSGPRSSGADDQSNPNDDEEGGDDQGGGDQGDEEGTEAPCTTAALVPGAIVREAELSVGGSGAVWDEIDLIR